MAFLFTGRRREVPAWCAVNDDRVMLVTVDRWT
jgi:hypothetical protein